MLTASRDLSSAFPNGEYSQFFRQEWLTQMAKEVRANRDFQDRTRETARWARQEIKRQESATGQAGMA